jgi:hypothetical protein
MSVQTEAVDNLNPIPASADQLGFVIEMARSHVHDVDSGIKDGTYDASDNGDIEEKWLALNATYALQGRLIVCLEAFDGVDTGQLADMGKGAMNRHRDRAYQDRRLYLEMREMILSITHDLGITEACDKLGLNGTAIKLKEARRLLNATHEDVENGVPAGRLVRFVNQVAVLNIWDYNADDGSPYKECRAPAEGFLDSHCCLMGLVQEARRLTT